MKNNIWHIIGVMSGTSLDGVDLVFVKFTRDHQYNFEILKKEAINYSEIWKKRLSEAFGISGEKLSQLHVDYGNFLGVLIHNFIIKNKLENIDFIASHGHTIFHRPEQNYTLQIGSGAVIATVTNCKVICDFRVQDIALGGQGAPLVPIGDKLLFDDYGFCLNLGGFANISFDDLVNRIAFDVCPVNIVLNHYTRSIGLEYDDKGKLASQGQCDTKLLNALNNLPYYIDEKPKSLGYEFIVTTVLPMIDSYKLSVNTVLNTFIEHVAVQIAQVINRNIQLKNRSVLVTGGGAFNDFLIIKLSKYVKAEIIIPEKEIIDFKEAIIFAFLGLLKDQNEINCLQSVTGASKDHCSGVVYDV